MILFFEDCNFFVGKDNDFDEFELFFLFCSVIFIYINDCITTISGVWGHPYDVYFAGLMAKPIMAANNVEGGKICIYWTFVFLDLPVFLDMLIGGIWRNPN